MRLELRGFLLDLVPDFTIKQHEGREALFRHRLLSAFRARRLCLGAARRRINSLARVGGDVSERCRRCAVRGAGVSAAVSQGSSRGVLWRPARFLQGFRGHHRLMYD